jgi:hypothetical protein
LTLLDDLKKLLAQDKKFKYLAGLKVPPSIHTLFKLSIYSSIDSDAELNFDFHLVLITPLNQMLMSITIILPL